MRLLMLNLNSYDGRYGILLLVMGSLLFDSSSPESVKRGLVSFSETNDDSPRGPTTSRTCEALCRELAAPMDPTLACKEFARTIPHPKMRRICTSKFREGYELACPLMCSRITRTAGGIGDIRPWIESITQNLCQDMSGAIPYPTTFNACKQGYSKGLRAAVNSVFERMERVVARSDATDGPTDENGSEAERDGSGTMQFKRSIGPLGGLAVASDVEGTIPPRGEDMFDTQLGKYHDPWVTALGTAVGYVDYALVARERVIAERRRKGSELKRGPACPVCNG